MNKKKILVIDDEPGFTEMVKLNLEATGYYHVRVENRGANALQAAINFQPNLILLDVIMPDAEGPEICYQIQNNKHVKHIPVVFLTATIRRDEVEAHNGNIGGHAFIAKPSGLQDLIECIESHISPS